MIIHFSRSGGFAGLLIDFTVDSAQLPAEESAALRQAVEAACFFELPGTIESQEGGADRFQYQIRVQAADREHSVAVSEAAMPESLQPLVRQLELLWRARR